jgi:ribonuclease P protein subunit RPR2
MKKHNKKDNIQKIALESVKILLIEAEAIFDENKELANSYVRKAKRLAMKVNLRIPSNLRKKYCKHCDSFLVPGKNLRVRTKDSRIVYYCMDCKKYMKFGLKPKKSK